DNAPLAGGIRGGETRPEVGSHAADVDDLAAAGMLHVRIGGFRHQECAGEIDIHDLVPFFRREVLRRFTNVHAGIVEEDVDASQAIFGLVDNYSHLIG